MTVTNLQTPGCVGARAVVVTDLDGTVAFDNQPPGPATYAALDAVALDPELRLVLASSRSPRAMRRLVGSLADCADLVACNGALVVGRGGCEVDRSAMDDGLVFDLLTALTGEPFCLDFGTWFAASTPDALHWMGSIGRWPLTHVGPLTGVLKVATGDHADPARIERAVAGRGELIHHADRGRLEIVARGVDKRVGLSRLLGADLPPMVALGNDVNDEQLIRAADLGVVVGDRLGHLSSHRVAPTDRAVARAIHHALARLAY